MRIPLLSKIIITALILATTITQADVKETKRGAIITRDGIQLALDNNDNTGREYPLGDSLGIVTK